MLDTHDVEVTYDKNTDRYQVFYGGWGKIEGVYAIKNQDVFSIKKLADPQDAIDSYAEHLFIGDPNIEFDFDPYLIDF